MEMLKVGPKVFSSRLVSKIVNDNNNYERRVESQPWMLGNTNGVGFWQESWKLSKVIVVIRIQNMNDAVGHIYVSFGLLIFCPNLMGGADHMRHPLWKILNLLRSMLA